MQFDKTGYGQYLTDRDLETSKGVWIIFPGGREFNILRAGGANTRYVQALDAAMRPHRQVIQQGALDSETDRKLLHSVYADTIVIGWRGINQPDGTPVEFTREHVLEYFEAFPEVFSRIASEASDTSNFSVDDPQEVKEALGES